MTLRYGRPVLIAMSVLSAGCYNKHVNGTKLPPDTTCTGNWTAVVTNNTNRLYDLYIGTRLVGTAEPRTTSRTIIEPRYGQVVPALRQSATTRNQQGPLLAVGALRMICE